MNTRPQMRIQASVTSSAARQNLAKRLCGLVLITWIITVSIATSLMAAPPQTKGAGRKATAPGKQSPNKTPKQTTPPTTAKPVLPSSEQACEGALEIVPRKTMTFVRKRRPAPPSDR